MPKVRRQKRKAGASQPYLSSKKRQDQDPKAESASIKPSSAATKVNESSNCMKLVTEFRKLCVAQVAAHPECKTNAEWMAKYMRNQFKFFGLKAPMRRELQKELVKTHKDAFRDRSFLLQFLPLLWEQEEREFQCFGVDLLQQFRKEILGSSSSEEEFKEAVLCVERLVTCKSWWDTVDALSYPVIGYFVQQCPVHGVPLMQEWIKHDDMWLRRVAILHQLLLKEKTDADRLFQFCLSRAHEKEFFIRKSIGWALREYSRTDKAAVKGFVEKNRESLSALSIREALKHC